ncbi:MAG: alkaline phosphatase D family protein [Kofleriaceae bacterium]
MTVTTRRDFVRLVGVAAAAAPFLRCGDHASPTTGSAAILEPTADSVIVHVWSEVAVDASVEIRHGDAVSTVSVPIGGSRSGAVELAGLAAATAYEVRIECSDGTRLGPHVARTAPRTDDPRPVRLAVFADVDANPEFDTDLVAHVVAAEPDLLVSLGDFPYTDNGPGVAMTVAAYRARHAEIRTLPKIRALLEAAPLYAIYDDHEFRNNWDAAFATTEADRYAAAMTVWDEFFPLRGATGDVRYRSWRWGANVECFLLDCRRFRSANAAPDDANKTMLGATQLAWLTAAIAASTAPFKLVFTSVPLDFGTGVDHWSGFTTERDALLDSLVGTTGLLFVTADQHYFAAHRHAHGIRELQFGPLARGIATPGPMVPGVVFRAQRFNAGVLDISADRIVIAAVDDRGDRFYEETLTIADLTPA